MQENVVEPFVQLPVVIVTLTQLKHTNNINKRKFYPTVV